MTDEQRREYILRLRAENAERQDQLQREIAQREAFAGPEPVDWRQRFRRWRSAKRAAHDDCHCREQQPQREAVSAPTLRSADEELIRRIVDERIAQWAAQERAETERRIAAVTDDLEAQAADALDEVERALNNIAQRMHTDLTNSDAARRAAVDAMHARYDVLEARLKLLLASENATVIEPTRSVRRTN